MKKVLVTGGSGFIGANLTRRLIRDGFEVHLILRKGYKLWRIKDILPDVCVHFSNLLEKQNLVKIIKKIKPNYIFNLAVYGAYPHQNAVEPMVKTNILGTFNLLSASLEIGFDGFIQVGSSSEYGFKDHAPSEDECLEPNSYYALTKSTASQLVRFLAFKCKANAVILRPYSVFGPFEEPGRFIPTLIIRCLQGRLPMLVDSKIARDFIYVDDFIEACLLAVKKASQHGGEIYNVGLGKQVTIGEAVDFARKNFDIRQKPKWGSMPSRSWDTSVWKSDSRKIKRELDWRPQYTFQKGFKETVQWFKNNPTILSYYTKKLDRF